MAFQAAFPNSIYSSQQLNPIFPQVAASGVPGFGQNANPGGLLQMGPFNTNTGGGGQPQINPDGSAAPSLGGGGGFGTNGPAIPADQTLSGIMAGRGYTPAGATGLVRDMPTSLIEGVLRDAGYSPGGGLGDLLYSIASPDQLTTLYGLLAAAQGGSLGQTYGTEGNFINNFYNSLIGGSTMPPSLSSVLGPAFGGSGDPTTDPFYGMLTGGDAAQQVGQLLGAVGDISAISMPQILRSALMRTLQRAGAIYGEQQGQGGNTLFVNWLRSQAPMLAAQLGG